MGLMYTTCIACFVVLLMPKFETPKFRPLRGGLFVFCGLLSVVPIYHIECLTDQQYVHEFHTTPWALGGFIYILEHK